MTVSQSKGVTHLQIEPTTRCNYTCGFCCGRYMDQSDIQTSDFVAMLNQLPDLQHLELQGEGEPLLHKNFFQMAKHAVDRGIKVSTITNGSLFTEKRIRQIVESGIQSIMISIESTDADAFKSIRGGKLERVKRGIRNLVNYRDKDGTANEQRLPVVGFAVTVMNSTRDQLAPIAELYQELGMDGGILMHTLSPMKAYSQHYDEFLAKETLSSLDQALAWSRYSKVISNSEIFESPINHFWDDLLSRSKESDSPRQLSSQFKSCPWLDSALFVNRHGEVSACPNIKDTQRYGWGKVTEGSMKEFLGSREEYSKMLAKGVIPTACDSCFIAEAICN